MFLLINSNLFFQFVAQGIPDLTMFVQFESIYLITGITKNDDEFLYCSLYNKAEQLLAERKIEASVKRK